jgi:hypothetical protein
MAHLRLGALSLQQFKNIEPIDNLSEDGMSAVKTRILLTNEAILLGSWDEGYEELRPVGVFTSVGHGEKSRLGVVDLEVFIWELSAVDGLTA